MVFVYYCIWSLFLFLENVNALRVTKVIVAGGSGRTGRAVVEEILRRKDIIDPITNETISLSVLVPARNIDAANEVFSSIIDKSRLSVVQFDLADTKGIKDLCEKADSIVWCATGFSDSSSFLAKIKGAFMLKFMPRSTIDISAVQEFGKVMALKQASEAMLPQFVMCSSAGMSLPPYSKPE